MAAEKMAIVVGHGSLASGLVSAMEEVLGRQPNVFALSNTGKSAGTFEAEVEALIAAEGQGKDVYLLTDLQGGSCATTCLRAARQIGLTGIFYGINLTLLLEFILHRSLPREEFFQTLVAKAQRSVSGILLSKALPGAAGSTAGSGRDALEQPEAFRRG
jgi:PTS system N-acetylgalactosamine-specific IIA component